MAAPHALRLAKLGAKNAKKLGRGAKNLYLTGKNKAMRMFGRGKSKSPMDKEKKDRSFYGGNPFGDDDAEAQICMPRIKQWQDQARTWRLWYARWNQVYYWRQRCL